MTPRVREILSWYSSDPTSVLVKLARILNHGEMGATGKVVFADISGGVELGPAECFAQNPNSYDPVYLFKKASNLKINAIMSPKGSLEFAGRDFAGEIPTILKMDHSVQLESYSNHYLTSSLKSALQLGCDAVAWSLPVGHENFAQRVQMLARGIAKAKDWGLPSVVQIVRCGQEQDEKKRYSLPIDQAVQAAHLVSQLGAHIIEVPFLDQPVVALRKWYNDVQVPTKTQTQRMEHLIQSCLQKQKIVVQRLSPSWSEERVFETTAEWTSAGSFGINLAEHFYRDTTESIEKYRQILLGV